jgi:hypothetical protein
MQAYELVILCLVWATALVGAVWPLWNSVKNSKFPLRSIQLHCLGYTLSCVPIVIALAVRNQASLRRLIGPLVQCGSLILVATQVSLKHNPGYFTVY